MNITAELLITPPHLREALIKQRSEESYQAYCAAAKSFFASNNLQDASLKSQRNRAWVGIFGVKL